MALAALSPFAASAETSLSGLTVAGKITFCSALTQPPFESLTTQSTPEGIDVDFGADLTKRIGLGVAWNNIPFSGLIPALQAGQCDAILSDLFVKEERMRVLDFVPYMYSQEVLLLKDATTGINSLSDLSGKKAATVTGTTATQLLEAASKKLVDAGKPPINIVMFPENTQALQQLQFGQVDAFGVAYEIAEYYSAKTPGTFKLGGPSYFKILTGIGLRKDSTTLRDALQKALEAMRADGSYEKLLVKYHLEDDTLATK
ncbi:MAG: ABC transporter substrate-binding protein [Janthinobacterium lividum]